MDDLTQAIAGYATGFRSEELSPETVSLVVERCATGMHGDRSFECRVSTAGAGQPRTWVYPNDVRQFQPYLPGTTVGSDDVAGDRALDLSLQVVPDNRDGGSWLGAGPAIFMIGRRFPLPC